MGSSRIVREESCPLFGRAAGIYGVWMMRQLGAYRSQMREQNNMGDIMAGVCCSSPEQDKTQEALFLDSRRSLTLQAPGSHTEHKLPSYLLEGKQKREQEHWKCTWKNWLVPSWSGQTQLQWPRQNRSQDPSKKDQSKEEDQECSRVVHGLLQKWQQQQENQGSMTEWAEDLLREDTGKAKVLTVTSASVVTSKSSPQEPWISEHKNLLQVPEWLRSLHPWRHWKPSLIRSWAACFNFHYCVQRRLDFMITKDPLRPHLFCHPLSRRKWEGLPWRILI